MKLIEIVQHYNLEYRYVVQDRSGVKSFKAPPVLNPSLGWQPGTDYPRPITWQNIGTFGKLCDDWETTIIDMQEPIVTRHAIGQGTVDLFSEMLNKEMKGYPCSRSVPENLVTAAAWLCGVTHPHLPIEQGDLYPLLGNGVYYMDPPDGGSPSLMTMLERMAEDAAKYRDLSK